MAMLGVTWQEWKMRCPVFVGVSRHLVGLMQDSGHWFKVDPHPANLGGGNGGQRLRGVRPAALASLPPVAT